jgi:hypothetical protein
VIDARADQITDYEQSGGNTDASLQRGLLLACITYAGNESVTLAAI